MSFATDRFPELSARAASGLRALIHSVNVRCPLTLFVFTYGDGGGIGFATTFKSNGEVVEVLQKRVARWAAATPPPMMVAGEDPDDAYLPGLEIDTWGQLLEQHCKPFGFALFAGRGERTQYIATGARENMLACFRDEVLPGLLGDMS